MTARVEQVLIVEDQPEGHRYLSEVVRLAYPLATIEMASSLAEALPLAERDYDLALVDLRLGDGLGIDWVTRYRTRQPLAWVVIATLFDDDELVFAALRAGVDGYVLKEQSVATFAAALTGLAGGEPAISPRIARKVLGHFRQTPPAPSQTIEEDALTAREREVLACIGKASVSSRRPTRWASSISPSIITSSRYTANFRSGRVLRQRPKRCAAV